MKLLILTLVCLNAASFVCSATAREMSLGDRLALKRRFQVQKQTSLAKDAEVTQLESLSESSQAQNHTQVDESSTEKTNPVMDVEDQVKNILENVTTTTVIPDVSSSPAENATENPTTARLPKLRPTAKPLAGRLVKTTTEKNSEEEVIPVTMVPKPVKRPTQGPRLLPVIKPFDPTRRPTLVNRLRPSSGNAALSIKPFRNMLGSKNNENAAAGEDS